MHKSVSGKINTEIEECVRNNVTWQSLPIHLKQVIHYIFNLFFFFFDLLISTQNHKLQHNNWNRDEMKKKKTKWKPENVDGIRKSIDDNFLFMHRVYVCAAAALAAHKHKHRLLWLIMILLYNRFALLALDICVLSDTE